jgi:hypothetical protein
VRTSESNSLHITCSIAALLFKERLRLAQTLRELRVQGNDKETNDKLTAKFRHQRGKLTGLMEALHSATKDAFQFEHATGLTFDEAVID